MAARARWLCKCGFEGKDMREVRKHQAKGQGHYRVPLIEWSKGKVERRDKVAQRLKDKQG